MLVGNHWKFLVIFDNQIPHISCNSDILLFPYNFIRSFKSYVVFGCSPLCIQSYSRALKSKYILSTKVLAVVICFYNYVSTYIIFWWYNWFHMLSCCTSSPLTNKVSHILCRCVYPFRWVYNLVSWWWIEPTTSIVIWYTRLPICINSNPTNETYWRYQSPL